MTGTIETIKIARKSTAEILATSLKDIRGKSEIEVQNGILSAFAEKPEFYPTGWYDPPEGGAGVLFDVAPYSRLQFMTLRDKSAWPAETKFTDESVGIVYFSPVDKKTGMIGDIGLSLYSGKDDAIRSHLRISRDLLIQSAGLAQEGMPFNDLFSSAMRLFKDRGGKVIGWMTTNHDPLKTNLGHTVPGSYEPLVFGETFGEVRETIRTKRVYINELEQFKIPATCAFTLEARLTDEYLSFPNAFFHVIVTFNEGKKEILTNFDSIFRSVGMDYML